MARECRVYEKRIQEIGLGHGVQGRDTGIRDIGDGVQPVGHGVQGTENIAAQVIRWIV